MDPLNTNATDPPEFKDILLAVRNFVVSYEVDSSAETQLILSPDRSLPPISEEEFLRVMYVDRRDTFQNSLLGVLASGGPTHCVIGNRGSGKTSVLVWCKHHLRSHQAGATVVIIDLNRVLGKQSVAGARSTHEFDSALGSEIRSMIQQAFFPESGYPVLAWALAGPPDSTDRFDTNLLSELSDAASDVALELKLPQGTRMDRISAITESLRSGAPSALMRDCIKAARAALRPAHVLQAAKSLGLARHIAIAYDNVDGLSNDQQKSLLNLALQTHNSLAGSARSIIAIRLESLVRTLQATGGNYDQVHFSFANFNSVEPLILPDLREDQYRAIVDKRIQYAQVLVSRLAGETVSAEHLGALGTPSQLVDELIRSERVHNLANGSIRGFLEIYCAFNDYLAELKSLGEQNTDDKGHVVTLFYLWLAEVGPLFGIHVLDVIRTDANHRHVPSVHYYLLATIANLRSATLGRVVELLSQIGFSETVVRSALADLCGGPHQGIYSVDLFPSNLDVRSAPSDTSVRLTQCGNELLTRTYSAIGYVWGRSYLGSTGRSPKEARDEFLAKRKPERIEALLAHLAQLTIGHTAFLVSVRDRSWPISGRKWLDDFREKFGVDRALHIERILDSAESFFPMLDRAPFVEFRKRYQQILSEVASNRTEVWRRRIEELGHLGAAQT